MVTTVESGSTFQVSAPEELFKVVSNDFVVDSSGQTFLLSTTSSSNSSPIVVDTTGILAAAAETR